MGFLDFLKESFGKKKQTMPKFVERMIMFKMNDGTWKWLISAPTGKIKTEIDSIKAAREAYKGKYLGAYDFYKFNLSNGEIIEIMSKLSYEGIWKIWNESGMKPNTYGEVAWGFKFKKDDEEWNKIVIIMSKLGWRSIEDRLALSSGDTKFDKILGHDLILANLGRLGFSIGEIPKKEFEKNLSGLKAQVKMFHLPHLETEKFNKIIDSMEKINKI